MPEFNVQIKTTGYQTYLVEAPTAEEAKEKWTEGEYVDTVSMDQEVVSVEETE